VKNSYLKLFFNLLRSNFLCLTAFLWIGYSQGICQNNDEVNFQVGTGTSIKDPNPYDSIFFSVAEASKVPLRVSELSLEGRKLDHFPLEVLTFKNLHTLNISYNRIDSIPTNLFDKCRKLRVLQYAGNELEELPAVLFHPALKVLDVSENNLTVIPDAVSKCTQLEELDLHANQLTTYPSSSFVLTALQSLILSGNPLTTVGKWVLNQPALKILFIDNTKIESLPDGMCNMNALRFLTLEEDSITAVPACFCELKKLKVLMVSGSALPDTQLQKLHTCLPELQIR
jgi:Leucine-rich repeat (LRR) protein